MYKYEMDPTKTVGATERTLDAGLADIFQHEQTYNGRTDGRSETSIPPTTSLCGGYNKINLILPHHITEGMTASSKQCTGFIHLSLTLDSLPASVQTLTVPELEMATTMSSGKQNTFLTLVSSYYIPDFSSDYWMIIHTSMALTHWGRVMHICVGDLTIIGSDNGLSPGWNLAIIWAFAGISLVGPLGTNLSEILIEIHTFSLKKIHLK